MTRRNSKSSKVYRQQARALGENLKHVFRVSRVVDNPDDHHEPPMTKEYLAARSGLSRSTVTRLTSGDGSGINPDLKTLCLLAATLNVPPAFLLMTTQDWQRLLGALDAIRHLDDDRVTAALPDLRRQSSPDVLAQGAIDVAARLSPTRMQGPASAEERRIHARARQGARAMVNVIDWGSLPGERKALFAIAVQLGTNTNLSEEA